MKDLVIVLLVAVGFAIWFDDSSTRRSLREVNDSNHQFEEQNQHLQEQVRELTADLHEARGKQAEVSKIHSGPQENWLNKRLQGGSKLENPVTGPAAVAPTLLDRPTSR